MPLLLTISVLHTSLSPLSVLSYLTEEDLRKIKESSGEEDFRTKSNPLVGVRKNTIKNKNYRMFDVL